MYPYIPIIFLPKSAGGGGGVTLIFFWTENWLIEVKLVTKIGPSSMKHQWSFILAYKILAGLKNFAEM